MEQSRNKTQLLKQ